MQEEGFIGRQVGNMIRRSVRSRFRAVYWQPPILPPSPVILACSHNSWFDGYIMFHVATRLGLRCVDWIQEFEAFPLFAKVGGMPFPLDRPDVRTQTIRRTIRLMQQEKRSLVIFPEGVLHPSGEVLPFGKAVLTVARATNAPIIPVALVYEFALHERPEAFVGFGEPIAPDDADMAQDALVSLLAAIRNDARTRPESFERLVSGTRDVNERWDMRRRPR